MLLMGPTMAPVEKSEREALRAFLLGSDWPFHTNSHLNADFVEAQLSAGWSDGAGTQTF